MKVISRAIAVMMVALLSTSILSGCRRGSEDILPKDEGENNSIIKEKVIPKSENETASMIKEKVIPKEENSILKELAVVYNNKSLKLSDFVDDKKLEDIFGKAEKIEFHTYSADDGLNMDPHIGRTNRKYKFQGLLIATINTLDKKEKFYVHQIEISDSKYTTPRKVKVGDTIDKLKEAYPEAISDPNSETSDFYIYSPVNHFDSMLFRIKDNKISSIKIYTLLE
ncbi:MAG: hypothetical protein K0R09_3574 [Clostridiales bacterium]|nr:hypothetical protein [Clostridiales bacterium]